MQRTFPQAAIGESPGGGQGERLNLRGFWSTEERHRTADQVRLVVAQPWYRVELDRGQQ